MLARSESENRTERGVRGSACFGADSRLDMCDSASFAKG